MTGHDSVSALVRGFLQDLVRGEDPESRFDRLRRLQDETLKAIHARDAGLRAADNLSRDATKRSSPAPA